MKKFLLSTLVALFIGINFLFSQAPPQSINYQGVARDLSGMAIPSAPIGLRISIRSVSTVGTVEYQETHLVTTNLLGLFTVKIGTGTIVSGSFPAIDWGASDHYVEIEMDETGGTAYSLLGTSQFLSVPYALYAETVGNADDADADPTNEYNTSFTLMGDTLYLTDLGGTLKVDLGPLDDDDSDSTNEYNDTIVLNGTDLETTDGGGTLVTDLSSLVEDDDADSTNELNTNMFVNASNSLVVVDAGGSQFANLNRFLNDTILYQGDSIGITDAFGFDTIWVDLDTFRYDPDMDPTNELQDPTLVGNDLGLTSSGTTVNLDQYENLSLTLVGPLPRIRLTHTDGSFISVDVSSLIDDADADPTNEFQTIQLVGNDVTLSDGGGTITLLDNDPANELITSVSLVANSLVIDEGPNTWTLPLPPPLVDSDDQDLTFDPVTNILSLEDDATTVDLSSLADDDGDSTNELNMTVVLNGTDLETTDGGGTITTDLSSLVEDDDADSTNELNMTVVLNGTDLETTDGGGTITTDLSSLVDDDDADSTNELNTSVVLNGTDLETTDAGGTLVTDFAPILPASLTLDIANNLVLTDGSANTISVDMSTFLDNTDFQDLSLGGAFGTDLEITNGAPVDLTPVVSHTLNLNGSVLELTDYANGLETVDLAVLADDDGDSTNELNTSVVLNGTDLETTDGGGTIITDLSSLVDDDGDSTNELNMTVVLNGTDLETTDGGGTITTDLSSLVEDDDADSTNELNMTVVLNGTDLETTDGGGTITTDLSSLVEDDDADSTNELNMTVILNGTDLETTDGGGTITTDLSSLVEDDDADSTNELNMTVVLNGTDLETTDAGGTITTDLTPILPASLTLDIANNLVLTDGSANTISVDMSTFLDNTDFQDLSLGGAFGTDLEITNGAPVDLTPVVSHTLNLNGSVLELTDYANGLETVDLAVLADDDGDSTNELNTSVVLNGTDLETTDGGGTITTDLSSLVEDDDADSTNELNMTVLLNGTDLETTDGGGTITTDLSSLVDDDDADSTNELNMTVVLNGTDLETTDAGGTITTDLTPVLPSSLTLDIGNNLNLTDGSANVISVDLSSFLDNTDFQDLSLGGAFGTDLEITNGATVDLVPVVGQTLAFNGNNLELTDYATNMTSVDLTPFLDNTDDQDLTFDPLTNILSLEDDLTTVDLTPVLPATLGLTGLPATTLDLTDGGGNVITADLAPVGSQVLTFNAGTATQVDLTDFATNVTSLDLAPVLSATLALTGLPATTLDLTDGNGNIITADLAPVGTQILSLNGGTPTQVDLTDFAGNITSLDLTPVLDQTLAFNAGTATQIDLTDFATNMTSLNLAPVLPATLGLTAANILELTDGNGNVINTDLSALAQDLLYVGGTDNSELGLTNSLVTLDLPWAGALGSSINDDVYHLANISVGQANATPDDKIYSINTVANGSAVRGEDLTFLGNGYLGKRGIPALTTPRANSPAPIIHASVYGRQGAAGVGVAPAVLGISEDNTFGENMGGLFIANGTPPVGSRNIGAKGYAFQANNDFTAGLHGVVESNLGTIGFKAGVWGQAFGGDPLVDPGGNIFGSAQGFTWGVFSSGVTGSIGGYYNISDRNLKKDIVPLKGSFALSSILSLKTYSYHFKDSEGFANSSLPKGKQFGFLAQELEEQLPEAVRSSSVPLGGSSELTDVKMINTDMVTPLLVEAMKEQNKVIESQKSEIKELQDKVNQIMNMLEELKANPTNTGDSK